MPWAAIGVGVAVVVGGGWFAFKSHLLWNHEDDDDLTPDDYGNYSGW